MTPRRKAKCPRCRRGRVIRGTDGESDDEEWDAAMAGASAAMARKRPFTVVRAVHVRIGPLPPLPRAGSGL